eukprot:scaffold1919_cov394-Prasinococcus_capsulatus_cf.AAC.2
MHDSCFGWSAPTEGQIQGAMVAELLAGLGPGEASEAAVHCGLVSPNLRERWCLDEPEADSDRYSCAWGQRARLHRADTLQRSRRWNRGSWLSPSGCIGWHGAMFGCGCPRGLFPGPHLSRSGSRRQPGRGAKGPLQSARAG